MVQKPFDKSTCRFDLRRASGFAAQPAGNFPGQADHGLEILDCQENAFQHGKYFMLHPAQSFFRLDRFDLEIAVGLLCPLFVRLADPSDSFPLPANGKNGVHGGKDPQAGFAEIILQAFEDEWSVEGMSAHHGCFKRQSRSAAHRQCFRFARVIDRNMDSRRAFEELD